MPEHKGRKVKLSTGATSAITVTLGVAISVGVGFLFYFKTETNTALATFAGLLGTVLTLQLEAAFRQVRAENAIEGRLRLLSRMERVSWEADAITQLLEALEKIDSQFEGTLVPRFAEKSIDRCVNDLKRLQVGHFKSDPSNYFAYLVTRTQSARKTILATSVERMDVVWTDTSGGRAYWRVQQDAIKRGVSIERVIIYTNWTDELRVEADQQVAAGVKVLRVEESQLDQTQIVDMAIWDEDCCAQTTPGANDHFSADYILDPTEVRDWIKQYMTIRSSADEYS